MRTKNLCAVLSLAVAGIACESGPEPAEETVAEAPKPAAAPTEEAKAAEPEPTKPLEGEALANHYIGCWNLQNDRKWEEFGACYDEKATSSLADSERAELSGRDAIVQANGKDRASAFTDLKGSPELVLVNGREIAAVALLSGTNDGPLPGAQGKTSAATNKQFGQRVFHAVTLDSENQITEETIIQDEATLESQLSSSDAPGRPAEVAPLAGSPIIVVAKNDATEKANVDLVEKALEALEKEDSKALEAVLADEVSLADQSAPENLTGKKAVSDASKQLFGAMSDIDTDCDEVWGAGPYVVAECEFSATNDGPWGKRLPKTGKSFEVDLFEVVKVQDGKIQEIWRFMNGASLARQLGLSPPQTAKEGVAEQQKTEPAPASPAGAKPTPATPPVPKDRPASGQK